MQVKKQQLEWDMEQWAGSKLRKECVKVVYCHPANLISNQSTFFWNSRLDVVQAGIKVLWKNTSNLRYVGDTTLMAETQEELKSFLMKVKEESEKTGLKLNIQKTNITASGPITSWQIDGEKWKQWQILFSWTPISAEGTAAIKLKDTFSLKEKLWQI